MSGAAPRHGGRDRAAARGARGRRVRPRPGRGARRRRPHRDPRLRRRGGSRRRVAGEATEADTVMRVLERNAEIETRYGGGFVQSIEGLEATSGRGGAARLVLLRQRRRVDGRRRRLPAARRRARSGGTTATGRTAMRVPAVVGSWPAAVPARATTAGSGRSRSSAWACRRGLRTAVSGDSRGPGPRSRRCRARPHSGEPGPRRSLGAGCAGTAAAALIEDGPDASGVFARFGSEPRSWRLGLGPRRGGQLAGGWARAPGWSPRPAARSTADLGRDRLRRPPGCRGGSLLDADDLRDRYAVVVEGGEKPDPAAAPGRSR